MKLIRFSPIMYLIVDRVNDDRQKTSVTLLSLVDIEPDILTNIFTNLNLTDRLNLAGTCKSLECFHNSRAEFWKNVWFDASKAESSTCDLTRDYENITLSIDFDPSTPSPLDILTPLTHSMKSLQMFSKEKNRENCPKTRVHPHRLIETLPLFADLVSLDLFGKREWCSNELKAISLDFSNVNPSASPTVVMTKLQNLKINIQLLAGIRSYVDLSQIKGLHTIDINEISNYDILGVVDELLYAAQNDVFTLIRRQQCLRSLILDFDGSMYLFDRPLALSCQLKVFKIREWYEESHSTLRQQDNLADFLESQVALNTMTLEIWRDVMRRISSKMLLCLAKSLSLPQKVQSINLYDHCDWKVRGGADGCEMSLHELHRIFLLYAVQPNKSTVCLNLTMDRFRTHGNYGIYEWFIPGLCSLYPHLEYLSIDLSCKVTPNLVSLGSLSHLHSLEITSYYVGSLLRDVDIPNLKKFKFSVKNTFFHHRMKRGASWELKSFLGRHTKLTIVKFVLAKAKSLRMKSYSYPLEVFVKDSFDLIVFAIKNLHELENLEITGLTSCTFNNQEKLDLLSAYIIDHPSPQLVVKLQQCAGVKLPENIGLQFHKASDVIICLPTTKNDELSE